MLRRPLSGILLALSLTACGAPDTTVGPADFNLTGQWRHSGDLRDITTGDSHIHEGRFRLTQVGMVFAGDGEQWGSCGSAHGGTYQGPLADPTPYPVSEGAVDGMSIRFKTSMCEYMGTFQNGDPNRITGSGVCTYLLNGTSYTFRGLWQADRLP